MVTSPEFQEALGKYALYMGDARTLELYSKWRRLEDLLGMVINCRLLIGMSKIEDMRKKGSAHEQISVTIFEELTNKINKLTEEINAIRVSLLSACDQPDKTWPAILTLNVSMEHTWEIYERKIRKAHAESARKDFLELSEQLQKELLRNFLWVRHSVLEPVIITIKERRSKRQSRSSLDGGRPRDVGVWPLLQAAAGAGLSIRKLAEHLVDLGFDKKPTGERSARIRREAKRLAEAHRIMMTQSPHAPSQSAENL